MIKIFFSAGSAAPHDIFPIGAGLGVEEDSTAKNTKDTKKGSGKKDS
jgi:hypothetical protein